MTYKTNRGRYITTRLETSTARASGCRERHRLGNGRASGRELISSPFFVASCTQLDNCYRIPAKLVRMPLRCSRCTLWEASTATNRCARCGSASRVRSAQADLSVQAAECRLHLVQAARYRARPPQYQTHSRANVLRPESPVSAEHASMSATPLSAVRRTARRQPVEPPWSRRISLPPRFPRTLWVRVHTRDFGNPCSPPHPRPRSAS